MLRFRIFHFWKCRKYGLRIRNRPKSLQRKTLLYIQRMVRHELLRCSHVSYNYALLCSHDTLNSWIWRLVPNFIKRNDARNVLHVLWNCFLLSNYGLFYWNHLRVRLKNGPRWQRIWVKQLDDTSNKVHE